MRRWIDRAIAQIPSARRRYLLVTIDGAGASHAVVPHLHGLNTHLVQGMQGRKINYSIGFDLNDREDAAGADLTGGCAMPTLLRK